MRSAEKHPNRSATSKTCVTMEDNLGETVSQRLIADDKSCALTASPPAYV